MPQIDEETLRRVAQATAERVFNDLRHLYPLDEHSFLVEVATGSAQDQVLGLREYLEALGDASVTQLGLTLIRPSRVAGGKPQALKFAAARDLNKCDTLNDVLSSVTIIALLLHPTARAILAKHGYRLKFHLGIDQTVRNEKVTPITDAKKPRLPRKKKKR